MAEDARRQGEEEGELRVNGEEDRGPVCMMQILHLPINERKGPVLRSGDFAHRSSEALRPFLWPVSHIFAGNALSIDQITHIMID